MSLAYSPIFAVNIIAGYLLTVLGAVLCLATAVWFSAAGEWAHVEPPSTFRALGTIAVVLFIVGLFWQLTGYIRLDYAGVW
jgi:protein-S-isoprenylcysteine O-methyltransferase Ste14